jgi:hypothetical protein
VATSNSIISIVSIAKAVIGAVAMQSTCTRELATSMESHAIKTLGLLLDIEQMLLIISTKEK